MKILVNGDAAQVVGTTLGAALSELGYGDARVATAVNEMFVPAATRDAQPLSEGDRVEIVAPQQGG